MADRSTESTDSNDDDDGPLVVHLKMLDRPPPPPLRERVEESPLEIRVVIMHPTRQEENPLKQKKESIPEGHVQVIVETKQWSPPRKKSKQFVSIGSQQPQGKG